jgi:hypothetical protein
MFLAICYREASPTKLKEFKEEVEREGKMSEEMGTIFETLAQPNPTIPSSSKANNRTATSAYWYSILVEVAIDG